MGTMTIDGRKVEFTDEKNVLTVIRNAGIDIPTLCYHSELSTFGACRLCTVEDDRGKTFASCSEVPRDGMVIHTNTNKLRNYRKLIVELLLAAHCRDCTTCIKINVSSAETVYVPARKFRESVHLDLHSVEQKQWLCLHSIKRLQRHSA